MTEEILGLHGLDLPPEEGSVAHYASASPLM